MATCRDTIDLNQLGIQMKFEEELKRFNKFQRGVLGYANPKAKHKDIELKTYAKYIHYWRATWVKYPGL